MAAEKAVEYRCAKCGEPVEVKDGVIQPRPCGEVCNEGVTADLSATACGESHTAEG